jgi:hypothetical protein
VQSDSAHIEDNALKSPVQVEDADDDTPHVFLIERHD